MTLQIENHRISLLTPFEENPRKIDEAGINKLKKSIKRFGLFKPILVWENSSGRLVIIGGNQRVRVLREMVNDGEDISSEVPTIRFEGSEKAAKIIALRDNHNDGEWDWAALPKYVSELADTLSRADEDLDPALMGFSEEDLADLMELSNSSDADLDRYTTAEPAEEVAEGVSDISPETAARDKVRKRFARFVIGNVRGRITVDQYGKWCELFEKYADRIGSTDIPAILSAMLSDIEHPARS
jgi:ParB-like chromosome segregation protein Spo0J